MIQLPLPDKGCECEVHCLDSECHRRIPVLIVIPFMPKRKKNVQQFHIVRTAARSA